MSDVIQDILDVGLRKQTKRDTLRKHLKNLSCALRDSSESPFKNGEDMLTLVTILCQKHIVKHKSEDVRMYCACALADVCYYCDEECPFDDDELEKSVFLFMEQLKGLAVQSENDRYHQRFRMLEALSDSNFMLFVSQLRAPRSDEPELLYRLFEVCIDLPSEHLNSRIEYQLKGMLVGALKQLKEIPSTLVHIVLRYLVEPLQTDCPHSFQLISSLLFDVKECMNDSVSLFLRRMIKFSNSSAQRNDGDDEGEDEEDDEYLPSDFDTPFRDTKAVFAVVFELSRLCPDLLSGVVMDFQEELEVENETKRLQYVNLWGKCFTAEASLFGRMYPTLLEAFLRRFVDVSTKIRVKMCAYAKDLLLCESIIEQRARINDYLREKAMDSDAKVRHAAVSATIETGKANMKVLEKETLAMIAGRVMDKRHDVQMAAMNGVGVLFAEYISEFWRHSGAAGKDGQKCLSIPSKLLKAATVPTARLMVSRLFHHTLLRDRHKAQGRCRTLMGIVAVLDSQDREYFESLLRLKAKACNLLLSLFELAISVKDRKEGDEYDNYQIKLHTLSLVFPPIDGGIDAIKRMINGCVFHRNKKVQRWLKLLCSSQTEHRDMVSTRHELCRFIKGDKGIVKPEFLEMLLDVVAMPLATEEMVSFALEEIVEKLAVPEGRGVLIASHGLFILNMFAKLSPGSLTSSYNDLFKLLQSEHEVIVEGALDVMAVCDVPDTLSTTRVRSFRLHLEMLLSTVDIDRVKIVTRALYKTLDPKHGLSLLCSSERLKLFPSEDHGDDDDDDGDTKGEEKQARAFRCLSELVKINAVGCYETSAAVAEQALKQLGQLARMRRSEEKVSENDESGGPLVLLLRSMLKFLGNFIVTLPLVLNVKMPISDSSSRAEQREECWRFVRPMLIVIMRILDCEGAIQCMKSESEQDALYYQAAATMLKICRCRRFATMINPRQLATLAMVVLHDSSEVRTRFTGVLHRNLRDNKLDVKFLVYLALSAQDPNTALASENKAKLQRLIERHRAVCEARTKIGKPSMMPEVLLSELLYYLAHDPDYRVDDDDSKRYALKIIDCMLDCLLPKEHHNYAFIAEVLNTMRQHTDATSDNNEPLEVMIELAHISLTQRYQNQEWSNNNDLQKSIVLNKHMFRRISQAAPSSPSVKRIRRDFIAYPKRRLLADGSPAKRAKKKSSPKKQKTSSLPPTPLRSPPPRRAKAKALSMVENESDDELERAIAVHEFGSVDSGKNRMKVRDSSDDDDENGESDDENEESVEGNSDDDSDSSLGKRSRSPRDTSPRRSDRVRHKEVLTEKHVNKRAVTTTHSGSPKKKSKISSSTKVSPRKLTFRSRRRFH